MKFALNIIDWQARAPGLSETEQWREWSRLSHAIDPAAPLAKLSELPMMTARRLSSGSKLAVDCGLAMLRRHEIDAILYTSRHGELERNYRILHALATEQALSPTDFTLSVHNSAVGNLTIAAKKPIVSSSLSAGRDTFQQGLCEVMSLLQAGYQRVLMVDFDGFLPEFYHPHLPPEMPTWPFAVALVIESGDTWQCKTRPHSAHSETTLPQSLLFLQHYLQDIDTFTLPGERVQWQWSQG
ncbi:beta-ketoacyl synthase chain length factor [Salmonella enterica subsp. enterica serovar Newport]|nr:beta-ketoacyl synthase chain length factor [Salmonella enterica subsp. enterica serovar Newport]EHS5152788.1 beta-ketoacyl synthase chain length factor [Salmonella enterica subsp. enterica serovar Newport]EHV5816158.1 beta-ketoacyl synthase chain length factor [Salmonella enterica subsp. enterica serovar Newport]EIC3608331.1 beta-ketoacyl synthase chain length factor [Salmonella enterica subsp. enterica serovar Newport]EJB3598445.1 beta-ketoacyl synthase chain length factor [Salmonella enter